MAVRRKRRRVSHTTSAPSAQRSWLNLAASLGALVMVLALGDQFASSAAGCYGAVSHQEDSAAEAAQTQAKTDPTSPSAPQSGPAFLVVTPDTIEEDSSNEDP